MMKPECGNQRKYGWIHQKLLTPINEWALLGHFVHDRVRLVKGVVEEFTGVQLQRLQLNHGRSSHWRTTCI